MVKALLCLGAVALAAYCIYRVPHKTPRLSSSSRYDFRK